jgi:polyvinyl alcohol dehydrogenase (cytochrome)
MEVQNRAQGKGILEDEFANEPKPGLTAIDPFTGKTAWHTPAPKSECQWYGDRSRDRAIGCFPAQSAAATVIPGVVFSGTTDGWFRAYDSATGKPIWQFNSTAQKYDTVNGVKGQPGGSIDGMGATVANGMVYQFSGFNGASNTGGNGTNVLLAFSVDGK